jgi:uncharacterized protein (TIGR02466 family)
MSKLFLGVNIYQSSISEEFYKFLMDEYDNRESYERLYQNENFWGGSDYSFVKDSTRDAIEKNLAEHVYAYIGASKFKLRNQWLNIQAHDGYLPAHVHSGNISYVIYLKVPEYLQNYNGKRPNDIFYAEGAIQFKYGNQNSLFPQNLIVHPEDAMILMFPSEVEHYVYPFRDKESLRISISGNIDL